MTCNHLWFLAFIISILLPCGRLIGSCARLIGQLLKHASVLHRLPMAQHFSNSIVLQSLAALLAVLHHTYVVSAVQWLMLQCIKCFTTQIMTHPLVWTQDICPWIAYILPQLHTFDNF